MSQPTPTGLGSRPLPLYQKVKAYISDQIQLGQWGPDQRIPSENDLVKTLHVSRMTVHRALRELTQEGLLTRIQGVGTFVAPQKPQSALMEIISIAEEIRRRGGRHHCNVHLLQPERVGALLAERMNLRPGSEVFHAVLMHYENDTAVQMADRYVNPAVAPAFLDQDFKRITPNAYLLSVAPITEVEHVVEAVMADAKTRALLNIRADSPCLVLHRTTWSHDRVATCSRFVYPGSRYRLGGRFKPDDATRYLVT
jgi:GntR family transcriptional regulator, histidine utilization repressor